MLAAHTVVGQQESPTWCALKGRYAAVQATAAHALLGLQPRHSRTCLCMSTTCAVAISNGNGAPSCMVNKIHVY